MDIVVCGVSHKTTPVEMLERLAFTPDSHAGVLSQLTTADEQGHLLAAEAILLCTCNRVELYAVVPDGSEGAAPIARFLAEYHEMPASVLATYVYTRQGKDAVRHLFSVASGLDSMVLGEPQILGQVRSAYETASGLGACGPILSSLFRHAIEAGKRVHTETSISQHAASVSYAAVELAAQQLGDLSDKRVLIVGAGKTGQLAAQCLAGRGVQRIAVANRSLQRAVALAEKWNGEAMALETLGDGLRDADIAISCTDAPDYLIKADQVRQAMAARGERPLLLLDIAIPRDIEPAAAEIPGVKLRNIDDLNEMIQLNLRDRSRDRRAAQAIVGQEVAKFMAWLKALEVTPTIVHLRQHAESIRQQELERAMRRLNGLSAHDADVIDLLTQRIINQLLHEPTVRLKQYAGHRDGADYVQAIADLFALDDGRTEG